MGDSEFKQFLIENLKSIDERLQKLEQSFGSIRVQVKLIWAAAGAIVLEIVKQLLQ